MISAHDRTRLLELARASVIAGVGRLPLPAIPADLSASAFGVFITLYSRGELRGCLGRLDLDGSLPVAVARLAAAVVREDPRFDPLAEDDLPHVSLAISLLTPPQEVTNPDEIVVGRDGLLVAHDGRDGLLLPQVALEEGWDRETLIAQTCRKAGLPPDAWQRGATLMRFEAEVFGDDEPEAAG